VVLIDPRAGVEAQPEAELRDGVALVGSQTEPPHRRGEVLLDPRAFLVADPEVGLRDGVPLVSSQKVPPRRRGEVLPNPRAVLVADPDVVLCTRAAWSAARRYNRAASAGSRSTPVPFMYFNPRLDCATGVNLPGGRFSKRCSR
jgi:hypothetical protein